VVPARHADSTFEHEHDKDDKRDWTIPFSLPVVLFEVEGEADEEEVEEVEEDADEDAEEENLGKTTRRTGVVFQARTRAAVYLKDMITRSGLARKVTNRPPGFDNACVERPLMDDVGMDLPVCLALITKSFPDFGLDASRKKVKRPSCLSIYSFSSCSLDFIPEQDGRSFSRLHLFGTLPSEWYHSALLLAQRLVHPLLTGSDTS